MHDVSLEIVSDSEPLLSYALNLMLHTTALNSGANKTNTADLKRISKITFTLYVFCKALSKLLISISFNPRPTVINWYIVYDT